MAGRCGRQLTVRGWAVPAVVLVALATGGCGASRAYLQDIGARPVRISDRQEPATKVELAAGGGYYLDPERKDPLQPEGSSKPYLLVDVGALNPLFAMSNVDGGIDGIDNPEAPFDTGEWGLQFSLPIGFHLFWDAFAPNNPILDTDYTFGFDLAGRYALTKRLEVRAGASWGHISTHLGDEYVIAARADRSGVPFDRVNVSYWPLRLQGGLRRSWLHSPDKPVTRWLVDVNGELEYTNRPQSLRGFTSPPGDYYSLIPGEADPGRVPTARSAVEPAVTIDVRDYGSTGMGGDATSAPRAGYWRLAATLAWRTVFPYHYDRVTARREAALDVVGGRAFGTRIKLGARQAMLYARYYRGPNPYGQFRNDPSMTFLGLGLAIVP